MNFKKIISLLSALILTFSLCSCGARTTSSVDKNAVTKLIGTELVLPENAENTVYFASQIDELDIGEARFTISGINYTLRAAQTDAYTDVSAKTLAYDHNSSTVIDGEPVEMRYFPGKQGVAMWYDSKLGISYSLYMDAGATQQLLASVARQCRSNASELSPGTSESDYVFENGVYVKNTADFAYIISAVPADSDLMDIAWRISFAVSVCKEQGFSEKNCHVFLIAASDESGKVDFDTKKMQTIVRVTVKGDETSSVSYTGEYSLADIIKQQ